jgi:septal ring factor EnvC (AmiA/AmiB activator)
MTDEPQPTVRTHSDEWCMALERERLAQIAELEAEVATLRKRQPTFEEQIANAKPWDPNSDRAAPLTAEEADAYDAALAELDAPDPRIAERDAEITRLRAVIAQLREEWHPKAQQEIAAMTAAREVARRYADEYRMHWAGMTAEDIGAFDRLVEAFGDG